MVVLVPRDFFHIACRVEWRSLILRIDLMEKAFEGTVQITVQSKTRKIVSRDLKSTLF